MKLGNIEVSGIEKIVINDVMHEKRMGMWRTESGANNVREFTQDYMVERVKKLASRNSVHIWVSGDTINIKV